MAVDFADHLLQRDALISERLKSDAVVGLQQRDQQMLCGDAVHAQTYSQIPGDLKAALYARRVRQLAGANRFSALTDHAENVLAGSFRIDVQIFQHTGADPASSHDPQEHMLRTDHAVFHIDGLFLGISQRHLCVFCKVKSCHIWSLLLEDGYFLLFLRSVC